MATRERETRKVSILRIKPSERPSIDYRSIPGTLEVWGVYVQSHTARSERGYAFPLFNLVKYYFEKAKAMAAADALWLTSHRENRAVKFEHHNAVMIKEKLWLLNSSHPVYPHPYETLDTMIAERAAELEKSKPKHRQTQLSFIELEEPLFVRRTYLIRGADRPERIRATSEVEVYLNGKFIGHIGSHATPNPAGLKSSVIWYFFPTTESDLYKFFVNHAGFSSKSSAIAHMTKKFAEWVKFTSY